MEVIYVDSLFCLNLLADYLLCLVSARACGLYLRRMRYFAAALIGAAYSVSVFLPGLGFLMRWPGKLGSLLLMGIVAFGKEARPFRCTLVFLALSALFAGAVWGISMAAGFSSPAGLYVPVSFRVSLLSFALCYAASCLFFTRKGSYREKQLLSIRLTLYGKESRFTALYDSGNALTDPVSGRRVMVVAPHALLPLLGAKSLIFSESDPVALMGKSAAEPELSGRLRLIPYSSVGGAGMMAALRVDEVFVDGKPQELLVALSSRLPEGDFEALL